MLPLWNAVWRFSEVICNFTPWSDNPTTEYVSKGNGISTQKRFMQIPVYCSTPHQSPDMESTECSSSCERVNTSKVACTHRGMLFSCEKEWSLVMWDNLDAPRGHCAKWSSQTQKADAVSLLTHGSRKRLGMLGEMRSGRVHRTCVRLPQLDRRGGTTKGCRDSSL